jgi:hypothetical protein
LVGYFDLKTKRNSYKALSDAKKVKYLEKRRLYKGYKKQWLYYRCREEGLLEIYHKLFKTEVERQDSGTKFSFGKYRGEFIEDIWGSDREYINWLSQQKWLTEYLEENDMIHEASFRGRKPKSNLISFIMATLVEGNQIKHLPHS